MHGAHNSTNRMRLHVLGSVRYPSSLFRQQRVVSEGDALRNFYNKFWLYLVTSISALIFFSPVCACPSARPPACVCMRACVCVSICLRVLGGVLLLGTRTSHAAVSYTNTPNAAVYRTRRQPSASVPPAVQTRGRQVHAVRIITALYIGLVHWLF